MSCSRDVYKRQFDDRQNLLDFDVGLRGNILGLALGQDLIGDFQRDAGVGDVDVDDVAFLHEANGAAGSRFGADVTDGSGAA